jgi:YHS domain-containing protein
MQVSPEIATAQGLSSAHDGQTYFFCGKGCKLDFDEDPARFFEPGYQPHM